MTTIIKLFDKIKKRLICKLIVKPTTWFSIWDACSNAQTKEQIIRSAGSETFE